MNQLSVSGHPDDLDWLHVPLELSKLRVEHTQCTDGRYPGRDDRPGGMYPLPWM
jgi:hypothetical protein